MMKVALTALVACTVVDAGAPTGARRNASCDISHGHLHPRRCVFCATFRHLAHLGGSALARCASWSSAVFTRPSACCSLSSASMYHAV